MTRCGCRIVENLTSSLLIWVESLCSMSSARRTTAIIPLQVKPQPVSSNLKACLGHRQMAIDSIRGALHSDYWLQSRKPSTQQSRVLTTLAASIAIEPTLPHCARWPLTLQRRSIYPLTGLVSNPAECLATLLNRKAWWQNQFSCRWPKWQVALGYMVPGE